MTMMRKSTSTTSKKKTVITPAMMRKAETIQTRVDEKYRIDLATFRVPELRDLSKEIEKFLDLGISTDELSSIAGDDEE